MPIHLRENQYLGVNAHLHSYLQKYHEWSAFHSVHITDLFRAIQESLSLETGYVVMPETSLQIIRDDDPDTDLPPKGKTVPDIGVYRPSGKFASATATLEPSTPGATIDLADTFYEPERVKSVVIRKDTGTAQLGRIITRIELLSPANKPSGSHANSYRINRMDTLSSGINLVELDYLHTRPCVLNNVPDYTKKEEKSYPYIIVVNKPSQRKADLYGFRVDEPIPVIAIPLEDEDVVTLDLNVVYNRTFESLVYYGTRIVDYEQLPVDFDTYDTEDQKRIQSRMKIIAEQPT